MQPDQLYNQLRFNLEQPYSLNKLSVRHKNPQPITIEKAGLLTGAQAIASEDPEQAEKELAARFSTLKVDRLKEAQFLAQRQLKKQKEDLLRGTLQTGDKLPGPSSLRPRKSVEKFVNKKPLQAKVSPTKKLKNLPVAGDSPPVKEKYVPITKVYHKSHGAGLAKRNLNRQLTHPEKPKEQQADQPPEANYKNGVHTEKLRRGKSSFSMPDLHKLAMEHLIQVQRGEITPQQALRKSASPKTKTDVRRPKSATPGRVKFVKPSVRASAARIIRERIYRQPLVKSLAKPRRATHSRGRVLRRHPTIPQYDPDYDHIDPEHHLAGARPELEPRRDISSPYKQKSRELPNPDEFIQRIAEARRTNETAERYAADPRRVVDEIERETRQRLEPLIRQAQALSNTMKKAVCGHTRRPYIHTISPQYNGGHDSRDMSADDLLHHPVHSGITPTDHPGPAYGDVRPSAKPNTVCGPEGQDGEVQAALDGNINETGEGASSYVSPDDVCQLKSMLNRLDEMQKEHIEIRHRWLAASNHYEDQGLLTLREVPGGDGHGSADHECDTPRPLFLQKSQSQGPGCRTSSRQTSPLGIIYSPPRQPHVTHSHHKDAGHHEVAISLPEKKIRSIEEGKKRYQKHLDHISHTPSAGFDPWKFAEQTADEIVDRCLAQVANELLETGDDLIQGLYAEEFIATKHSPTGSPAQTSFPT